MKELGRSLLEATGTAPSSQGPPEVAPHTCVHDLRVRPWGLSTPGMSRDSPGREQVLTCTAPPEIGSALAPLGSVYPGKSQRSPKKFQEEKNFGCLGHS